MESKRERDERIVRMFCQDDDEQKRIRIRHVMMYGRNAPKIDFMSLFLNKDGELDTSIINTSEVLKIECYDAQMSVVMSMVEDINIEVIPRLKPESRDIPILSALASVGIDSRNYSVEGKFYPHSRDFYRISNLGEFKFCDEIIEEFYFPDMGAEKLTKNKLSTIGVLSDRGVVSINKCTNIIDAVRQKLDGYEVIVFNIKTNSNLESFYWDNEEIKRIKLCQPGHYEKVDGQLYFLSGENSLSGISHDWRYLTTSIIEMSKKWEGFIIRMSGKQYRVRIDHCATLQVKEGKAVDMNGNSYGNGFRCMPGMYDFHFVNGRWSIGKRRDDKNFPDSYKGIREMLECAVLMADFRRDVNIPKGESQVVSGKVLVEELPIIHLNMIDKVNNSGECHQVFIRGGKMKENSVRKQMIEDFSEASVFNILRIMPNQIISSGMPYRIERSKRDRIIKVGNLLCTTNVEYSIGDPIYLVLIGGGADMKFMGKKRLRVFLLNERFIPLMERVGQIK